MYAREYGQRHRYAAIASMVATGVLAGGALAWYPFWTVLGALPLIGIFATILIELLP